MKGTDNLVDLKIGTSEVVSAFNSYNKFTQPIAAVLLNVQGRYDILAMVIFVFCIIGQKRECYAE